jgi:endonuclease/exonuclease/phosphatase family metal-dependent hydrolase
MSAITGGARLKVMTYNIGGGRKDAGSILGGVIEVIREESPDILALQEAVEWLDSEQRWHSLASTIADALGYIKGLRFGPTLSMQEHFHPDKAPFVHAVSHGWLEWRQGNAILSRWDFVPLEDRSDAGKLYNIPLSRPLQYEGNRDTEPRYALLARVKTSAGSPFIIGTHLSTLIGERGGPEREIMGKSEQAQEMRLEQTRHLLDFLKEHVLKTGELVFLMGDFNATVNEACIADVLETEAGFVRLIPDNDNIPTHRFKVKEPIDHIFVYPAARLVDDQCRIVDTPLARQASDHLPVVADVSVI